MAWPRVLIEPDFTNTSASSVTIGNWFFASNGESSSGPFVLVIDGCGGQGMNPGDGCFDSFEFDNNDPSVLPGRYADRFWLKDASYNLLGQVDMRGIALP